MCSFALSCVPTTLFSYLKPEEQALLSENNFEQSMLCLPLWVHLHSRPDYSVNVTSAIDSVTLEVAVYLNNCQTKLLREAFSELPFLQPLVSIDEDATI